MGVLPERDPQVNNASWGRAAGAALPFRARRLPCAYRRQKHFLRTHGAGDGSLRLPARAPLLRASGPKTAPRIPKRPFGASALRDSGPARTAITKSYLQISKYTKTMNVICIFFTLRTLGDGKISALHAGKPAAFGGTARMRGPGNQTVSGTDGGKCWKNQQIFTEKSKNYKNAKDFSTCGTQREQEVFPFCKKINRNHIFSQKN